MSLAPRPNTDEIARHRPDTGTSRIARPNYLLPGTESARKEVPAWRRLLTFLKDTWGGRLMLACALCGLVESRLAVSIPLPWKTGLFLLLLIFGRAPAVRLARSLFYRVRAKLLMAYVLTALVPLVLGILFIFVSWMILFLAFSTRLVTNEFQRREATLSAVATTALSVAGSGTASKADLDAAFATALGQHPSTAWTVVRDGVVLASRGAAPRVVPVWMEEDRFAGLVRDGEKKVLRGVARKGNTFAIVEIPYDASIFVTLDIESGIVVNLAAPAAPRTGRPNVRVSRQTSGSNTFVATHDLFDSFTGARATETIPFSGLPP